MTITNDKVREDLQTIKKKVGSVSYLQNTINAHRIRLQCLKGAEAEFAKTTLEHLVSQMQNAIADTVALENKYIQAILSLNPKLRNVVLEYYINAKSATATSISLHYDRRYLFRIIETAVEQITDNINKSEGHK